MTSCRRWTDEEMGTVWDTLDMPLSDVSKMIDRSAQAISVMRSKLRSGWSPMTTPWTEDDREFLRKTPYLSATQISELLGRSRQSVNWARSVLAKTEGINFYLRGNPNEIGTRPLVAKTCIKCGLLLDATWFKSSTAHNGRWTARCVRCLYNSGTVQNRKPLDLDARKAKVRRASASRAKLQAITQQHAHRHGQLWVGTDDAVLSDPDMTVFEKAMVLQRTYAATLNRCADHGYRSRTGRGDPQNVQWIVDNPNEQVSAA